MTPTSDVPCVTSAESEEIQNLKNQVLLLQRKIDSMESRKRQDDIVVGLSATQSVMHDSETIVPRVLYAADSPCVANAKAAKRAEIVEVAEPSDDIEVSDRTASAHNCCVLAFILSQSNAYPHDINCNDQHTILEWPHSSKQITSHLLCGDFLRLIQGRWVSDRFVCLQQKHSIVLDFLQFDQLVCCLPS